MYGSGSGPKKTYTMSCLGQVEVAGPAVVPRWSAGGWDRRAGSNREGYLLDTAQPPYKRIIIIILQQQGGVPIGHRSPSLHGK